MLKQVIKQLWSRRHANRWVLLELTVVFVVVWLAVDPVYVLFYQKNMSAGFDYKNVYCIDISVIRENSSAYLPDRSTPEALAADYRRMTDLVKNYPGVEAVAALGQYYPWATYSSSATYTNPRDSTSETAQNIYFLSGYDFFEVFRFCEAESGDWRPLAGKEVSAGDVFITSDVKQTLFGDKPAIGKILVDDDNDRYRIRGVVRPIKFRSYQQPYLLFIHADFQINLEEMIEDGQTIFFRVRSGIPEKKFLWQFKKEMTGKLRTGNWYVAGISSYDQIRMRGEEGSGTATTIRLQIILTLFFMMNIFLGIFASFWLRSQTRCSEIGLRLAVGGTPGTIRRYFLAESWALVTAAFIAGMFIQFQIVYFKGFYENSYYHVEEAWPLNAKFPHFIFVSLIVYVVLLITVLLASWLPAYRASRTNPVDALREE